MNLNEISRNFLCYFFQFAIKFYYFEIKQEDGNKKYGNKGYFIAAAHKGRAFAG